MVPPPPAEWGEVEVAAISGEHGAAAPWGLGVSGFCLADRWAPDAGWVTSGSATIGVSDFRKSQDLYTTSKIQKLGHKLYYYTTLGFKMS